MAKVVGVRFKEVGKLYYFSPLDIDIKTGDKVIVETTKGMECGSVILGVRDIPYDAKKVLKPIKRKATVEDLEKVATNKERERQAYRLCKEKIIAHGLDMKLIMAEYAFDQSKILFYFTADGRVDFRELVRDLAGIFKMRIELRQVGVRDETRIVGGIGSCGRSLCCHSYLSDFVPVSIKMAKEQNLSLNPQKISGVCGRLMCCLKNEEETYQHLNATLPRQGEIVKTIDGRMGSVASVNVLRQRVRVLVQGETDEKELIEYPVEEITFTKKRKKVEDESRVPTK